MLSSYFGYVSLFGQMWRESESEKTDRGCVNIQSLTAQINNLALKLFISSTCTLQCTCFWLKTSATTLYLQILYCVEGRYHICLLSLRQLRRSVTHVRPSLPTISQKCKRHEIKSPKHKKVRLKHNMFSLLLSSWSGFCLGGAEAVSRWVSAPLKSHTSLCSDGPTLRLSNTGSTLRVSPCSSVFLKPQSYVLWD